MRNLRKSVADISKNKRIRGVVVEFINGLATVKLAGSKRLLRGLTVVGSSVVAGQSVLVDYSSGIPIVQAGPSSGVSSLSSLASFSGRGYGGGEEEDILATGIEGDGINKITVGTTEPTNPSVGDLWIDTN